MVQVLATRTPISPTEAIDALWHAHQDVIGGPCPIPLLEILCAQSAFETARWKSMWNYNFGNLRGHGDAGSMAIHGANEIVDGHEVIGAAVEGGFAAYSGRYEGARALVRFFGTASQPPHPNRYQAAWDFATAGDFVGFVRELRQHGYFTASLQVYIDGVHRELLWLRGGPIPEFLASLTTEA